MLGVTVTLLFLRALCSPQNAEDGLEKPFLLFIKQIELAPKGPWPVESSHTRVLWLILAPCCLCGRKWGRGEEARLCRKPRGSSTPGTHVLSSLRWEMPVCAPPPPHPQTRTIWQINSAPVGHTTAADREKQGRLLCAGSYGQGAGQCQLLCWWCGSHARPHLDSMRTVSSIPRRSQPFQGGTHADAFSLSDSEDNGHCSSAGVAPISPWAGDPSGEAPVEAPGLPYSEGCLFRSLLFMFGWPSPG